MSDETTEKPYTRLREFITEAINGKHTAEDVVTILDNIEMGIGLEERDKAIAEKFGSMPANDRVDPVWLRGFEAGYKSGTRDAVRRRRGQKLKRAARKGKAN
jgi:hypothetical protein